MVQVFGKGRHPSKRPKLYMVFTHRARPEEGSEKGRITDRLRGNLWTVGGYPYKTIHYNHQERKNFYCLFLKAEFGGALDNVT